MIIGAGLHIVGAGMAGLLSGRMLSHRSPVLYESQPDLPNNHSAVLRFRSSIVGDTLKIPFRKVNLIKTTQRWRNPVADALAYSRKNTGVYLSNRSINSYDLLSVERYIAPPNLIPEMASGLVGRIIYSAPFGIHDILQARSPVVSTIPMPRLMELLEYPGKKNISFRYVDTWNVKATIPGCDAYVTVNVPDPSLPFSRISITGDELIVECNTGPAMPVPEVVNPALHLLGIQGWQGQADVYHATYGKIIPIDDNVRREFLHWATVKFNVYSLGRFATWRPSLLLDDLVNDIRLIDKWAFSSNKYDLARAR